MSRNRYRALFNGGSDSHAGCVSTVPDTLCVGHFPDLCTVVSRSTGKKKVEIIGWADESNASAAGSSVEEPELEESDGEDECVPKHLMELKRQFEDGTFKPKPEKVCINQDGDLIDGMAHVRNPVLNGVASVHDPVLNGVASVHDPNKICIDQDDGIKDDNFENVMQSSLETV